MASTKLPQPADYIVVGGGTAGLVVAARLSEDPNVNVLVLESGPDRTNDPKVQDPKAWQALSGSDLDWKVKMTSQSNLNNRTLDHPAGRVLGGSSAINGMAYVAPSPAGIDAWGKLGNPDWTWKSLLPCLQKSYTVNAPDSHPNLKEIQRPTSSGPVQLTYPALSDPGSKPLLDAWNESFATKGQDLVLDILAEEKSLGPHPYAATIDSDLARRSGADRGYGAIAAPRSNVNIVTDATVHRILLDTNGPLLTAAGVEVMYSGQLTTIRASKEIILAAGAFHTPKLLELSGIGQKERLARLGIPVVLDQPGVGENLQNHLMAPILVPLKHHPDLANITPGLKAYAMTRLPDEELSALLSTHATDFDNITNKAIRAILENPNEPTASVFLGVVNPNLAVLAPIVTFSLSRGNCHVTATDPDVLPTVHAGLASRELDMEILARHVQKCHELIKWSALNCFFEDQTSDLDIESIKENLRGSALPAHHACGTAAMLPQNAGGVVDQKLTVYGTSNLRIVDASVFPLISFANPLATVYAVAERAADLIRGATI